MTGVQKPDQVPQIDNSTVSLNSSGQIQVNPSGSPTVSALTVTNGVTAGSVTTLEVNPNSAQTTIAGTTAGSIVASMPFRGSSYKKVMLVLSGYENDTTTPQSYTFPTAFSVTPTVTINTAAVPGVTVSTTSVSLAPDTTTAYTGIIIIEGY